MGIRDQDALVFAEAHTVAEAVEGVAVEQQLDRHGCDCVAHAMRT